jgi:hypothetical protein
MRAVRWCLNLALIVLPALIMGLIMLLAFGHAAHAQRIVVLDDAVREVIARDWDKRAADPYQAERAYCLRYKLDVFVDEIAYRVTGITPAQTFSAGHSDITYVCAVSAHSATLHVHTPASCDPETAKCTLEGAYARQCFPSDIDTQALNERGEPFGLVQCDRKAAIFYWPKGITPPPKRG